MPNFTNFIKATTHMKSHVTHDVISFCKSLFISKIRLKTAAAKTNWENSLLTTNIYIERERKRERDEKFANVEICKSVSR